MICRVIDFHFDDVKTEGCLTRTLASEAAGAQVLVGKGISWDSHSRRDSFVVVYDFRQCRQASNEDFVCLIQGCERGRFFLLQTILGARRRITATRQHRVFGIRQNSRDRLCRCYRTMKSGSSLISWCFRVQSFLSSWPSCRCSTFTHHALEYDPIDDCQVESPCVDNHNACWPSGGSMEP
jgi:hypothetical protein